MRDDPCSNLNFRVEIKKLDIQGFCHISGLESVIEVQQDDLQHPSSPTARSFRNIVLRRGIDKRRDLWDWYQVGEKDKRCGVIVILNAAGEEFLRIRIHNSWPCRWKLTALDAIQSEVLLEEIELVIESFQIQ